MMLRILKLREPLEEYVKLLQAGNADMRNLASNIQLIVGEYDDLTNLLQPLHSLKEATVALEAGKTPTAHLVLNIII